MQHPLRHRAPISKRRLTVAFAALALVPMLAACNDDASSDDSAATATITAATTTDDSNPTDSAPTDSATDGSRPVAGEPDLLAVSQCMRENGIADFPDPGPDGVSLAGLGIDPDSPQFKAAEEACKHLMPQSDDAASSGSGTAGESDWEKVVPGGDCECADGSEFSFFERRADPTKVVFFLDGGGSCFDATSCAFVPESYDWKVNDDPAEEGGIFDFARADNPFGDYSFVYVPSCTGDTHLGDVTREYTPELTVEHNGYVNGTAALSYLAENYPDATQVVVVGKTNGSIATPVYGGLGADLLPDAQVIVFGGQSGHIPDDPDLNAQFLGELWGAYDTMPDWEVNEGLTARDWGPRRFWIQAGLHDPEIVLARFDTPTTEKRRRGRRRSVSNRPSSSR